MLHLLHLFVRSFEDRFGWIRYHGLIVRWSDIVWYYQLRHFRICSSTEPTFMTWGSNERAILLDVHYSLKFSKSLKGFNIMGFKSVTFYLRRRDSVYLMSLYFVNNHMVERRSEAAGLDENVMMLRAGVSPSPCKYSVKRLCHVVLWYLGDLSITMRLRLCTVIPFCNSLNNFVGRLNPFKTN